VPSLTYESTLEWLYALESRKGMDFRLERIQATATRLGSPQRAYPVVHVGGTNGKGSTAAMLHSIYRHEGRRVGLYTSPHLLSFRERIRIGPDFIEEPVVVDHTQRVLRAAEEVGAELTFFEIATLMAFVEFARQDVDVAIVEVGLGGRLDATNIVDPLASLITTIGLEHREYLGDTVEAIAAEKAGIIKAGAPVITGPMSIEASKVIDEKARAVRAPWLRYGVDYDDSVLGLNGGDRCSVPLAGAHQVFNASLAVVCARTLRPVLSVTDASIARGVAATRWPGRLETFAREPLTILDAAHNVPAALTLRAALEPARLPQPRVLVFGVMRDKDWREMIVALAPFFDRVILVPVANRRSLDPSSTLAVAADFRPSAVAPSALQGLQDARAAAGRGGSVVVAGSIFLVSELYRECGGGQTPFDEISPA
jgi:dihydrofolate synthase/folylpolyglutamate synthase